MSETTGIDWREVAGESEDDVMQNAYHYMFPSDLYAICEWAAQIALSRHASGVTEYDLVAHIERQRAFSRETFGPHTRNKGVIDHIRKELLEIEADPTDPHEWADLILLALDGAWRNGMEPQEIAEAIRSKLEINERREWPDWRTADPDKAIEHVRTEPTRTER